jgi:hypothetical protein
MYVFRSDDKLSQDLTLRIKSTRGEEQLVFIGIPIWCKMWHKWYLTKNRWHKSCPPTAIAMFITFEVWRHWNKTFVLITTHGRNDHLIKHEQFSLIYLLGRVVYKGEKVRTVNRSKLTNRTKFIQSINRIFDLRKVKPSVCVKLLA